MSSADWRPSITSSLEKPKKNESLRSISVTRTASAILSESRVASSNPPNPAPRIRTCLPTGSTLLPVGYLDRERLSTPGITTSGTRFKGLSFASWDSFRPFRAEVTFAAAVAALVWANLPGWHSYESVWTTTVAVRVGNAGVTMDLRHWVNEGLMTLFFLVVGLEAKRQLDLGELRERRRLAIPALAAIGGMAVPVAIYLAVNPGGPGARGWGAAMSTDTALALGALALLTPRAATRLRVFLLTVAVFDDLGALAVIAIVYTNHVSFVALGVAVALFAVLYVLQYV